MVATELQSKTETRAFELKRYQEGVSNAELRDDVVSYLGEYRLELQKYNYHLLFSANGGEEPMLRDPHQQESMVTKAKRAIKERNLKGEPTHREEADLVGLLSLEHQLLSAVTNDTVLWASPPGPKEEGYGNYGFIFFGKVKEGEENKKDISLLAIRLENPSLLGFNCLLRVLLGKNVDFSNADDFVSSPFVISKDIKEKTLDGLLMENFNFVVKKEEKDIFKKIMDKMAGMVEDFIVNPTQKGLHALENYALKLRHEYASLPWQNTIYNRAQRLEEIVGEFGFKPPKALGSCGSSSTTKAVTSNVFNFLSSVNNLFSEDNDWFTCPKCHYQADRPVGNTCPRCGLTKEEYAKESGQPICA